MSNNKTPYIPVGISACLMGQKVRFDGGHKRSNYCLNILSECFDFKPFCPEVAAGLGTPRQPIRLVGDASNPRALGTRNLELDATDGLAEHADFVSEHHPELCGYILMKGSPSCGMERVKVYHPNGMPNEAGSGIFAARLMANNPALPVEEEGRLNDAVLRENFITRVFVYHAWKQQVANDPSMYGLIQFHSRHKYQVMAHSYEGYRELGRYLAQEAPSVTLQEAMDHYILTLMNVLQKKANRKSHTNVLLHIMGYMKKELDSDTKQDLLTAIEEYRTNKVHLVVPLTLLKHYLKRHGNGYIMSQAYLNPYPHELGLRNYI